MGAASPRSLAQAGCTVLLNDALAGAAERGLARIDAALGRLVEKGTLVAAERAAILGRIAIAPDLTGLEGCDLVIEAASEEPEIKSRLFAELDQATRPEAILASNTSSISITLLGAQTKRPGKVIGMHFMNPVPVMRLIEVVRGLATDDATYDAVVALGRRLGKQVVTAAGQPRLHRQPAAHPLPQRGLRRAAGIGGHGRGHRHRHQARLEPPDGAVRAG
jgi:3-hydroxybutyryl-CoA dehydrogenase